MKGNLEFGPSRDSITRRAFLERLRVAGCAALLAPASDAAGRAPRETGSRRSEVVLVHSGAAASWDFKTGWYGDHVDQGVVDAMTRRGLLALTRTKTVPGAWARLAPGFRPGMKIAIKVNLTCFLPGDPEPDPAINALIEPVNAIIGTLVAAGVPATDIAVYDVAQSFRESAMPARTFVARCLYPGVSFVCRSGNPDPYSVTEAVRFNCPPPPAPQIPDLPICNVLADADFLINMPIIKYHEHAHVTLSLKNHFGSIARCDACHPYLPVSPDYRSDFSAWVEIYRNPNFQGKTVLTVGDGLFGNWYSVKGSPRPWRSFLDRAPGCLFFAVDPVAVDSVMADFIEIERWLRGLGSLPPAARDYLSLAEAEGMGTFETGNPWRLPAGSGYQRILFRPFVV